MANTKVRRYRGYRLEVTRDHNGSLSYDIYSPLDEIVGEGDDYSYLSDAFEDARLNVDELIEELEAPVAMYEE